MKKNSIGLLLLTLIVGCDSDSDNTTSGVQTKAQLEAAYTASINDVTVSAQGSTYNSGACAANLEDAPIGFKTNEFYVVTQSNSFDYENPTEPSRLAQIDIAKGAQYAFNQARTDFMLIDSDFPERGNTSWLYGLCVSAGDGDMKAMKLDVSGVARNHIVGGQPYHAADYAVELLANAAYLIQSEMVLTINETLPEIATWFYDGLAYNYAWKAQSNSERWLTADEYTVFEACFDDAIVDITPTTNFSAALDANALETCQATKLAGLVTHMTYVIDQYDLSNRDFIDVLNYQKAQDIDFDSAFDTLMPVTIAELRADSDDIRAWLIANR